MSKYLTVVTKALSHAEVAKCPEVQAAIRAGADGFLAMGTWDQNTVRDQQQVIAAAKKSREHTVIGDLLVVGSIKFFEPAKSNMGDYPAAFATKVLEGQVCLSDL